MVPYSMQTQLTLAASVSGQQFPNADLLNTVDKPIAVHRMIPRVIALDSNGLPLASQPDIETREALVSIALTLTGLNQPMVKDASPVFLGNLLGGTTSERYWRYEEPFVLPNGNGVIASANVGAFPAGVTYTQLRITLLFQGYLLVVAPPQG